VNKQSEAFDVVVIGGGNAALCAAITAAELGSRVIILEGAPKEYRGGNSRHTRNFRCMHNEPISVLVGSYSEDEYFSDLLKVTDGKTNEKLARIAIKGSRESLPWMIERGVRFQPPLSGTLSLSKTNAFFMGGGKSLVNAYYRRAKDLGIIIKYEAEVENVAVRKNVVTEVTYQYQGTKHKVLPKSVVVASGGFQADIDWLTRAWGEAAKNFLIRGTPYNRGKVLHNLLSQGVKSVGDPTQCHAVAIDGRAPKFDGGIVTRLDCVPFSIVVNENGKRFYDEGEDVWPKRYAIWGRLIASQPNQVGYVVIDSKSLPLFMPSVFPPIKANSLEELADKMALPDKAFMETVEEFNQACGDTSNFHSTELDGVSTRGIKPKKAIGLDQLINLLIMVIVYEQELLLLIWDYR